MHEAITSKFTKTVVFQAKYRDVEKLIQDHFRFDEPYSIVAAEEAGNDCSLDFDLDGKLDEFDLKEIAKMIRTKDWPTFRTLDILNYFVSEKILEPGQYIIRISW